MIGRRGTWIAPNGMKVPVEIVDGREAYGRTDVLIRPVGGSEDAWVDVKNVAVGGEQ